MSLPVEGRDSGAVMTRQNEDDAVSLFNGAHTQGDEELSRRFNLFGALSFKEAGLDDWKLGGNAAFVGKEGGTARDVVAILAANNFPLLNWQAILGGAPSTVIAGMEILLFEHLPQERVEGLERFVVLGCEPGGGRNLGTPRAAFPYIEPAGRLARAAALAASRLH